MVFVPATNYERGLEISYARVTGLFQDGVDKSAKVGLGALETALLNPAVQGEIFATSSIRISAHPGQLLENGRKATSITFFFRTDHSAEYHDDHTVVIVSRNTLLREILQVRKSSHTWYNWICLWRWF